MPTLPHARAKDKRVTRDFLRAPVTITHRPEDQREICTRADGQIVV